MSVSNSENYLDSELQKRDLGQDFSRQKISTTNRTVQEFSVEKEKLKNLLNEFEQYKSDYVDLKDNRIEKINKSDSNEKAARNIYYELLKNPEKISVVEACLFSNFENGSELVTNISRQSRKNWRGTGGFIFDGNYVQQPKTAPALWMGAGSSGESIVDFISREYKKFLGRGLHRKHLRSLDLAAADALRDWESSRSVKWLTLPTLPEYYDAMLRWMDKVGLEVAQEAIPSDEFKKIRQVKSSRAFNKRNSSEVI